MSSFRFEQHGAVGKLVLASGAASEPGVDYPSSLRASLHQAANSDIRVLHLASASGGFALGEDLGGVETGGSKFLESFAADTMASYRMIEELPIPTVASVPGMAMGGGFELLLAFDFLVVAESSVLVLPEVSVGAFPLAGGVQRLAARVGRARATRLVLLSEPIAGRVAVDLGIATHLAADAELDTVAEELVQHLATGATLAYGKSRALIRAWSSGGVSAADVITAQLAAGILDTHDAATGMATAAAAMKKGEPIPPIQFTGR